MPRLPITGVNFGLLLASWNSLTVIASIEECWDNLVQNYIEFEMELIRSAMNSIAVSRDGYHEANQTRLLFSRRLSNLLHSCKSYLDHTPHHLKRLTTAALDTSFKAATSAAYDESTSYRFMEALRNYAQHRDLPLHGATFDAEWTGRFAHGEQNKGMHRHSSFATIDVEKIRADKGFKVSVLTELANSPDQLDVSILVREYVEKLAQVHESMRTSVRHERDSARAAIRTAIAQYAAANGGDVLGLSVAEFDDTSGSAISYQYIFQDLSDRIQRLIQQNSNLVNLRLCYVSSEITPARQEKRLTP